MADYLDHTRIAQKLLDQQSEINDLTAAVGRVEALAVELDQGCPWTGNERDIANRIRAALTPPAP